MAPFSELPQELTEGILLYLDPLDVARLSQCSRLFHSLVYNPGNQSIWRMLYLDQGLDNPEECVTYLGDPIQVEDFDFKTRLQQVMRARSIIWNPSLCKPEERLSVIQTLIDLFTTTIPLTKPSDISNSLLWGYALLKGSAFIDDLEDSTLDPPLSRKEALRLAHLHTLFGLTANDFSRAARTKSRAFVYDMRKYHTSSAFGPFILGGRVNWEHIKAVHHLILMHLVDVRDEVETEGLGARFQVMPMSLPYTQLIMPMSWSSSGESKGKSDGEEEEGLTKEEEEEERLLLEQDWAGVAGDWRISFCFCDHRELIKYNESAETDGLLDTSIFEDPEFGEVFRSLNATLHITDLIHDPQNPYNPVIRFHGTLSQGSSTISGKVKITPDGQVHWDFFSGEQGNAIWSSHGIHIGGLRSTFGIIGTWTTVFHDVEDPVGPFWMRKQGLNEGILLDHVSH